MHPHVQHDGRTKFSVSWFDFSYFSYRVFIKYCVFFPRILEILPPLPRQLLLSSAAIGCTKNYQPIGVTVYTHCVEGFEGLLQ